MLKLHRVDGGPVTFGPGTMLAIDDRQPADRRAFVEVVEAPGEGQPSPAGFHVVRTLALQQFKVGETIGVDTPLPKALIDLLVPPDAPAAEGSGDPPPPRPAARRGR